MPDLPRQRRSAARYIAPLALLVAIAGTALVVKTALKTGTATTRAPDTRPHPPARSTHRPPPHSRPPSRAKSRTRAPATAAATYVVRPGDTFDVIAARTGVPLRTLEALNPGVSPDALRVGERLTLRR